MTISNEVIQLPEWPSTDYFPSQAMAQYLPKLCQYIAGYRVFSWEYYCLMLEHWDLDKPANILHILRCFLRELKSDLWSIIYKRQLQVQKVDLLVVSNIPHTHAVLKNLALALATNGQKVAWYGFPIAEAGEAEYLGNITDLSASRSSQWGSAMDSLRLWLSLPSKLMKSWVLSHKSHLAYRSIAKVAVKLPLLKCVLHSITLERCRWLMRSLMPKQVIIGFEMNNFGGGMAIAGYEQQAEVTVLQHGLFNPVSVDIATTIACWSTEGYEYLETLDKSAQIRRIPSFNAPVIGTIHHLEQLPSPVEQQTVLFLEQWSNYTDWQWGQSGRIRVHDWLYYLQNTITETIPETEWRVRYRPGWYGKNQLEGWLKTNSAESLRENVEKAKVVITMNSTAGLETGAMGRPIVFMWSPDMVWLNSMAPLKELFVRSKEELVLRLKCLLNQLDFYQEYKDKCVNLSANNLGFPNKAEKSLRVLIVVNKQM